MAVRGSLESTRCICFDVVGDGRLQTVGVEAHIVTRCYFQRVRIIEALCKQWFVDPDLATITDEQGWRLLVWERRPLSRLQWDLGEWLFLGTK